jgi:CRISPR-associated protein Cas2
MVTEQRTMYYIIVYDIASPKRLPKILKTCRKYLSWVQKSVFEGELSKSQYISFVKELKAKINKKEDSIIFYKVRNTEVINKELLGINKNDMSNFI